MKRFATTAKPSMKRRDDYNDYYGRRIYLLTLEVDGRRPLLGRLAGCSQVHAEESPAVAGNAAAGPYIALTPLGKAVETEFRGIPRYYPQIEVVSVQVMPDHLHGILFVHEALPVHLSQVITGFKVGCNRILRQMAEREGTLSPADGGTYAAAQPQPTQKQPPSAHALSSAAAVPTAPAALAASPAVAPAAFPAVSSAAFPAVSPAPQPLPAQEQPSSAQAAALSQQCSRYGRLFASGYNDLLLKSFEELQRWKNYLADNPRRLALKRARPEWLRPVFGLDVCGRSCSAVGNRALLQAPRRLQVRVSRSIDPRLLTVECERVLAEARAGAVLVSPCISPGEKEIMRQAFDEGLTMIVVQENGLTPFSKPSGERFEACAQGRLLLLSPFEHHNERRLVTRDACSLLNALAWDIAHAV